MSTTTTKAKRLPRTTQGDSLVPSIDLEAYFGDDLVGTLKGHQEDDLSAAGNVLFEGKINRGWRLPGDVTEALNALSFKVNGVTMKRSEKGVNVTAPSKRRDGTVITGSGGELIVSHSTVIDASTTDEPVEYMVNVHAKRLKTPVTGKRKGMDLGFQLRLQGIPKGQGSIGTPGPQFIGEADGFAVDAIE